MKKLSVVFSVLSILLSDVMCAVVAYGYRAGICANEHSLTSFPADTAFWLVIPYGLAIAVCVVLAVVFKKKAEKQMV